MWNEQVKDLGTFIKKIFFPIPTSDNVGWIIPMTYFYIFSPSTMGIDSFLKFGSQEVLYYCFILDFWNHKQTCTFFHVLIGCLIFPFVNYVLIYLFLKNNLELYLELI